MENIAKNPMQPLISDEAGVVRFKKNKIVSDLLDFASKHGMDLNTIGMNRSYSNDDHEQLAQLIGYSVSGFGDLSYVSDETFDKASKAPIVQDYRK